LAHGVVKVCYSSVSYLSSELGNMQISPGIRSRLNDPPAKLSLDKCILIHNSIVKFRPHGTLHDK